MRLPWSAPKGTGAMMRFEIWVFAACAAVLVGWLALGPDRYVHRQDITVLYRSHG
jgi:hypothetical protein